MQLLDVGTYRTSLQSGVPSERANALSVRSTRPVLSFAVMGHAASSCKGHPLATGSGHSEAIWSEISRQLTAYEWAHIAGTCRASWFLQVPHLQLPLDLPAAGYKFVLSRCHAATSISAAVWNTHAADTFEDALNSNSLLTNVKQLNVTDADNSSVASSIYKLCPYVKAVSVRTKQFTLHARPSLQHLDLETHIEEFLQQVDWQAFPQLETLRLCHHRDGYGYPFKHASLDLSGLQRLRSLHIVNWSPNSITVTAGCQVHAAWQPVKAQEKNPGPGTTAEGFFAVRPWIACHEWILRPCWADPGANLVSLQIEGESDLVGDEIHAINAVLQRQQRLEQLKITSFKVGSKEQPLMLPSYCSEGMNTALQVDISTTSGCWLRMDDTSPARKTVALNTKDDVHVGILCHGASHELQWYDWKHYQGCFAISLGDGSSVQQQVAKAMSDGESRWYLAVERWRAAQADKNGKASNSVALNKRKSWWCVW